VLCRQRVLPVYYTIFDIQSTGVNSDDRLVEVGLLQMDHRGDIIREYETLLQPNRDIPNSSIHGITESMVEGAPTFLDVSETINEFLSKTDLLLAFNLPLKWRMLGYAFMHESLPIPSTRAECLLSFFRNLVPNAPRKLKNLCVSHGVSLFTPHRSLPRVQAIAKVLYQYLDDLPQGESRFHRSTLQNLPSGLAYTREMSQEESRARAPILERLTSGLNGRADSPSYDAYFELLDLVFADSVLEPQEALALFQRAAELGMSQEDASNAHERYVQGLLQVAYKDGYYTEMEAEHLESVAKALKVEEVVIDKSADALRLYPRDLKGMTVSFSGTPRGRINGQKVTRKQFAELVKKSGVEYRSKVTPEMDYLVFEDQEAADCEKLQAAKKHRVALVSEQVFWNWLGIQVL
jgi:DNA polymerase III subunit epsilon